MEVDKIRLDVCCRAEQWCELWKTIACGRGKGSLANGGEENDEWCAIRKIKYPMEV